jgi:hypothetical protein
MGPDEILTLVLLVCAIGGGGYWLSELRNHIEDIRRELQCTDQIAADQGDELRKLKKRVKKLRGKGDGVPAE